MQDTKDERWENLISNDVSLGKYQEDETIKFTDEEEEELFNEETNEANKITFDTDIGVTNDFNIDDI